MTLNPVFYIFHDIFFIQWGGSWKHPIHLLLLCPPEPNFIAHCGPQVTKFAHRCASCTVAHCWIECSISILFYFMYFLLRRVPPGQVNSRQLHSDHVHRCLSEEPNNLIFKPIQSARNLQFLHSLNVSAICFCHYVSFVFGFFHKCFSPNSETTTNPED